MATIISWRIHRYWVVARWVNFHYQLPLSQVPPVQWNKYLHKMYSDTTFMDLASCKKFFVTDLTCQRQLGLNTGTLGQQPSNNEAERARLCRAELFQLLKHAQCILRYSLCLHINASSQHAINSQDYEWQRSPADLAAAVTICPIFNGRFSTWIWVSQFNPPPVRKRTHRD